MTEQFANFARSSLSAPITATQTFINVASAKTFPLLGTFRVVVQSFEVTTQTPTSEPEIMIVTAVSGTKFTVTRGAEGTIARAFASGTQVVNVMTAGVIAAIAAGGDTPTGNPNSITHLNDAGTALEQTGATLSQDGGIFGIHDGANDVMRYTTASDQQVDATSADSSQIDYTFQGDLISFGRGPNFNFSLSSGGQIVLFDQENTGAAMYMEASDDGNAGLILGNSGLGRYLETRFNADPITFAPSVSINTLDDKVSLCINDTSLNPVNIGTPRFTGGLADSAKLAIDGNFFMGPQSFGSFGGKARAYLGSDYAYFGSISGSGMQVSAYPGQNDPIWWGWNYDNDFSNTSNPALNAIYCATTGTVARVIINNNTPLYDDGSTTFQVKGPVRFSGNLSLTDLGSTLKIKEGTGGFQGSVTMTSGVATVTIAGLATTDHAFVNIRVAGGTLGARVKAVCTTNTLTITSISNLGATVITETSTYDYFITRPA